jgi:hypothetical protein
VASFFLQVGLLTFARRENPIQKQFLPRPTLWHYHVI